MAKSTRGEVIFSCINSKFGLLTRSNWSVCILESKRSLPHPFSQADGGASLAEFPVVLPTHSDFFFCSFHAMLLHSTMWFAVSSQRNVYVLLCFILSIFVSFSFSFFYHVSFRWWFFTEVWVTTSHLKSPGLFLLFWPFSIVQWFWSSPLVILLPSPPVPLVIL